MNRSICLCVVLFVNVVVISGCVSVDHAGRDDGYSLYRGEMSWRAIEGEPGSCETGYIAESGLWVSHGIRVEYQNFDGDLPEFRVFHLILDDVMVLAIGGDSYPMACEYASFGKFPITISVQSGINTFGIIEIHDAKSSKQLMRIEALDEDDGPGFGLSIRFAEERGPSRFHWRKNGVLGTEYIPIGDDLFRLTWHGDDGIPILRGFYARDGMIPIRGTFPKSPGRFYEVVDGEVVWRGGREECIERTRKYMNSSE